MTQDWTEEEVAAYVDGSLNETDAARVRALLASDPAARAAAEEIERSNALLRRAFDDVIAEPPPARLRAAILGEPGKVAFLRRRPSTWTPVAMAASIALLVGVGLGLGGGWIGGAGTGQIALGDAPSASPLQIALENRASGTAVNGRITPMLTFRDKAGRYCREFEAADDRPGELTFGIACRTAPAVWRVEIVVQAQEPTEGREGFAPASGPAAEALDAALDALGAGDPVTPATEAKLIRNGWSAAQR